MSKNRIIKDANLHPAGTIRSTEPTIWALRKNIKASRQDNAPMAERSLYEHIYGYDPILVSRPAAVREEEVRKGSAGNPGLNILNPQTNFAVKELTSEDTTSNT